MNAVLEQNYDNRYMLEKHIKSLDDMHAINKLRREKYEAGIKLHDLKLYDGYIWLDQFGQMWRQKSEIDSDSYTMYPFPETDTICPYCGKKFSLYNKFGFIHRFGGYDYTKDGIQPVREFFHKECNVYDKLQRQQKEFEEIFSSVYDLKQLIFKPIPNEYCACDSCPPWFIVTTPDGQIKIGWRKRVINIEWLEDYKTFDEKFDSEDVTKGFGICGDERYIHAWGKEKCKEYLLRAMKGRK